MVARSFQGVIIICLVLLSYSSFTSFLAGRRSKRLTRSRTLGSKLTYYLQPSIGVRCCAPALQRIAFPPIQHSQSYKGVCNSFLRICTPAGSTFGWVRLWVSGSCGFIDGGGNIAWSLRNQEHLLGGYLLPLSFFLSSSSPFSKSA